MEFLGRLTIEIGIEMARLSPWLSNQPICLRPSPTADRDAEGGAARGGEDKGLAFDPDDGDVEDHGDGDGSLQVETEVVDAVCSNWPQDQGAAATELLDPFLVHRVQPCLARMKVTEPPSLPRATALPSAVRLRIKEEELYLVVGSPPRVEFTDLSRICVRTKWTLKL